MIKTQTIPSFPANENPFQHDLMRMGAKLGNNVMIMTMNHTNKPCQHLVIVNTETGERLLVQLLPKEENFSECEASDKQEFTIPVFADNDEVDRTTVELSKEEIQNLLDASFRANHYEDLSHISEIVEKM